LQPVLNPPQSKAEQFGDAARHRRRSISHKLPRGRARTRLPRFSVFIARHAIENRQFAKHPPLP
jgi:hypothetical protein